MQLQHRARTLRRIRQDRALRRTTLAQLTGCSHQYVSHIEQGLRPPTVSRREALIVSADTRILPLTLHVAAWATVHTPFTHRCHCVGATAPRRCHP